ncbi:MAG: tRNA uridine-5-carboxymethylaminomethyl(34) synthesis enzyme MnmG [Acutalibacteraceae bacterium]|nr:tRNA uridine-5-carboxymethylaminomethyl(34) synthesis enzyme MnmG [Acutalibacteraceae bacterium]
MISYKADNYDVAVIGAGHAGIEAALAAARLKVKTVMFTVTMDWIGNMPCNPSIGGTAKGHLVRELDALGGEMGKAADKTTIQSRMLNRGKGPAVHSLRAQIDRRDYSAYMKHAVELQENLDVKQAEVTDVKKDGENWIVTTKLGAEYTVRAVIFATGTFLKSKIYVGEVNYNSGPDGLAPSMELGDSLKALGLPLRRFKTGTPARVDRASVNFDELEIQYGDSEITPFSFSTNPEDIDNSSVCYIAYTNSNTEAVIRDNLDRSPLYSGDIEGVGPRYCPSIEDKIVRFADKKRHLLFIEPCGKNTEELYLQGMSSSLPEEVQIKFYRTIKGLENVKIMRNAYAIEYDCIDPLSLSYTLEIKEHSGLYGAGQFNGSSGYEEAAVQGFVAGVNAALKIRGEEPLVFSRTESYIGTLIDDLVTKGCSDPYRMMTSRSEYRLLLRQDNADERMMPIGRKLGLINDSDWQSFLLRKEQKEKEIERLKATTIAPSKALNDYLESMGTAPMTTGMRLAELIKRPQLSYDSLAPFDMGRPKLSIAVREKIETEIKYEGYIARQKSAVEEMLRLERKLIPQNIDYGKVGSLRLEAVEKLSKIRPENIGQASRISGVSPADISVLLIYLEKNKNGEN